jgi:hypothetical protein
VERSVDLETLEARIDELSRELRDLRRCVGGLEAWAAGSSPPTAPDEAAPGPVTGPPRPAPLGEVGVLSLIGRTLLVLAGAYLLRAITDASLVPRAAGAGAGLAYAAWWMARCDRAAARALRTSAAFHGLAGSMIAFPLIFETTVRFGVLRPGLAAAAVVGFALIGLAVGRRRELETVAWLTTVFALATAVGLLRGTRDVIPFAVCLLVLAAMVEALAFEGRWLGLRWPVALVLDGTVLLAASLLVRKGGLPEGFAGFTAGTVISIQMALLALTLASTACRTLVRGRKVLAFEIVQGAAALVLGLGGAVRLAHAAGAPSTPFGVLSLLIAGSGYAVAFAFVDRRSGRGRNFYFYTTLAGLLALLGSRILFSGGALAVIWLGLAVAAVWLGGRFDRNTLRFQGAVYLAAGAGVSGLLAAADAGLRTRAGSWPPVGPIGLLAVLAAAVSYALVVVWPSADRRWPTLLPHACVAAILCWSLAGLAARGLEASLGAAPGFPPDPAVVGVLRTAVLAALAATLAWTGRRWNRSELIWLLYPTLVAGGIKLVLEDLRHGRPSTLFLSLALYGGALIAAPRLARRED